MKVSARNVFEGTVTRVHRGTVNAEVVVTLPGGTELVAIVTNDVVGPLYLERLRAKLMSVIQAGQRARIQ